MTNWFLRTRSNIIVLYTKRDTRHQWTTVEVSSYKTFNTTTIENRKNTRLIRISMKKINTFDTYSQGTDIINDLF